MLVRRVQLFSDPAIEPQIAQVELPYVLLNTDKPPVAVVGFGKKKGPNSQ